MASGTGAAVWVFGYASLIWRPGFTFQEVRPAYLFGYHRAMCVYSLVYRGSREHPGLVAGLLPGGSCHGQAFKVTGADWPAVKQYLYDREMIYEVYIPKWLKARIDGRRQTVYGFVANPFHDQFAGQLTPETAARLISQGRGEHGSGLEYLENTVDHLRHLGITDHRLGRILKLAKTLAKIQLGPTDAGQ